MDQDSLTPRDYLAIARRRKWFFFVPALLVFAASIAAALLWPPTYRSEATVLVEQPEIPEDLVNTLITDYVERRLESITRRVMVTENLLGIIERYGLYRDLRQRMPATEVVEEMRDDIRMEILSADVVDPRSGRTTPSTVAFQVSFDYTDPETAQRVANELVSLYLNENLRQRRQRTTETATFLREERERVQQRLAELDRQFGEFKAANNGSLPDQILFVQQDLARTDQELRDLNRQLQTLQEREAYVQAQLALTEPYQLFSPGGGRTLSPKAQLESLRVELASLRARYGAEHPDVRRYTREVRSLEQTLGVGGNIGLLEQQREAAQASLDELQQRYTADHPDVQRARRELASVEGELTRARRSTGGSAGSGAYESNPDNPAYIQLQAELNSVRAELPAVQVQRQQAMERSNELQRLLMKGPLVGQEYGKLDRQLQEAMTLLEDLSQREMTAQLGQNLEIELKGERFSLIEPPLLPTEPARPNKLLIIALGLIMSIGSGVGVVTLAHLFDDGVYSSRDVAGLLGEPPLTVVPTIVTTADRARRATVRLLVLGVVVAATGLALWFIHVNYVPLDVAWFTLQRWAATTLIPFLPGVGSGFPVQGGG
jgi:succinoglycan biosynthesis transport protein ExoP